MLSVQRNFHFQLSELNASNENYFDDLMDFVEKIREDELRATYEVFFEAELEIIDLLKKEGLTKDEEQRVKQLTALAQRGAAYGPHQ